LSVFGNVHENWRWGQIVIPQIVMNELEVPLVLSGVRIDRNDRVTEEIGAGPIAAVVVSRGRAEGHIEDAACFIGGHVPAPNIRAGPVLPAIVEPGLVTGFAGLRYRLKLPQSRAGARV